MDAKAQIAIVESGLKSTQVICRSTLLLMQKDKELLQTMNMEVTPIESLPLSWIT